MSKINSKRMQTVLKRDFKEYKQLKSFKLIFLLFCIVTAAVCIWCLIKGKDNDNIKELLGNITFLLAFIPPILNVPVFTTVPLTRDKENRTIANLLATPLVPSEIIWGKSLAIFIPGFVISVLAPLIVLFAVNIGIIIPYDDKMFLPISLLVVLFVVTPIFCLGLVVFSIQLSLLKSPELAVAPAYLIGFTVLAGVPLCVSLGYISLDSWNFVAIYGALAILLWIIVLSISSFLTKEKIILSN